MSTDDEREPVDHLRSEGGHRALREDLGAYVLGALDPDTRLAVEQHLDGCASCRDEVARLSALPSLLDRLSIEEVTHGPRHPPAELMDDVVARVDRHRRRDRRTLRAWQAAAAGLAAAVVLVAWAPWQSQPELDALVASSQPVAAAIEGQAQLLAWEWGTTVRLEIDGLPDRDAYLLWAVAVDGRRQQAGTWGPTSSNSAQVIGASSILRDAVARVEVTDAAGEVLAVFEPDAS